MKKLLFSFSFLFLLFPSIISKADVSAPSWYLDKKASLDNYIETKSVFKTGVTVYNLYDFTSYSDKLFTVRSEELGKAVLILPSSNISCFVYQYYVEGGKVTTGKDSPSGSSVTKAPYLYVESSSSSSNTFPLTYKGINFDNEDSSSVFPPPPSIDDDGQYGYNFIYPKDGDVINLHASSDSNYYKVPFRIDVKNYLASGLKKSEEFIVDNSRINNYKTVVDNISWVKKPNILGTDVRFFVDGYFYIPVSSLNSDVSLSFNTFKSDNITWINNSIKVRFTSDGSLPEYNPNPGDTGGNVVNDGSVNVGGEDFGQIPKPPKDGDLASWLSYIGNLLIWLVTYPFKLLGNIITTLIGYINGMFSILQPVTNQLNSVLSFIPSDILNVCWGFLSFTLLYSVIKSVMKMIRG